MPEVFTLGGKITGTAVPSRNHYPATVELRPEVESSTIADLIVTLDLAVLDLIDVPDAGTAAAVETAVNDLTAAINPFLNLLNQHDLLLLGTGSNTSRNSLAYLIRTFGEKVGAMPDLDP